MCTASYFSTLEKYCVKRSSKIKSVDRRLANLFGTIIEITRVQWGAVAPPIQIL